ncbi:uncharacterized protein LOC125069417 isoform X2 [Vanessa atalanta]|uniref:uncharacterized protein LOC125069417 isoform X2 n=1 Tax=Vanessa atalanta TaxID=42275 RepID=UPI001FCD1CBE|nr:uncharacterized protein LOC125069417 isoform X2 [Vanessa atalanta]
MQAIDVHNKLFASDNFEYVEINKTSQSTHERKTFVKGIKNTLTLLNGLENSFKKSSKYEDKLLKYRKTHKHSHHNDIWNTDDSTTKDSKISNTDCLKSPRSIYNVTESWSTMSMVCLQYQYEELNKRYNTLLQAYNEGCTSLSSHDNEVLNLRKRINDAHEEITNANKTILTVGNKYLTLKHRKFIQKVWYEGKIQSLKRAIRIILLTAERACLELNEKP